MVKTIRVMLWSGAALLAAVALAIGLDIAGGRALWPWPEERLTYIFISAMLLSDAVALAWTAYTLDLDASKFGALGLFAMSAGLTALMTTQYRDHGAAMALYWAVTGGLLAATSLVIGWVARSHTPVNRGPMPSVVRASFLLFFVTLSVGTAMLLLPATIVFPWPLQPASSRAFGCMFLASAIYFFDGWWRPSWSHAIGQLLGFLVYDAVLIIPWLQYWPNAHDGFLISLVIYLVVLLSSGLLAVFYLFAHPPTRIIGRSQ
jgi:hypothetical protein